MNNIRLGHINFINCLPLSYGLYQGGFGKGIAIHADIPSQLNRMVTAGELDVSPVSSIIYAQNSKSLQLLPNASISANGALQSIMLVSKLPIEHLDGKRIALTAKSATSHGLLKIILQHAYQAVPEYFISSVSLEGGVLDSADAVLFIGDDALYAYHNRIPGYYYYDMGAEWKKLTGLVMVYAVWVVNRRFAAEHTAAVADIYKRVTGGFRFGLEHLAEAVDTQIGKVPFTSEQITNYLRLLDYRFPPEYQKALLTYYELAWKMGLIAAVPEIEFAEVMSLEPTDEC